MHLIILTAVPPPFSSISLLQVGRLPEDGGNRAHIVAHHDNTCRSIEKRRWKRNDGSSLFLVTTPSKTTICSTTPSTSGQRGEDDRCERRRLLLSHIASVLRLYCPSPRSNLVAFPGRPSFFGESMPRILPYSERSAGHNSSFRLPAIGTSLRGYTLRMRRHLAETFSTTARNCRFLLLSPLLLRAASKLPYHVDAPPYPSAFRGDEGTKKPTTKTV